MGGTDVWDKMRMAMFYSLEATSHCHKWWQKCFWGIIDGALVNAFICWRSVDPSRRTHMRFMTGVHQALVNNRWDTIGHWGARSLQSPDVTRRQKKFKGKYVNKTPPTPVTIIPTVKSPTGVTHELVLLNKTALHQNMIRRKEVKPNAKAEKRCVQCKKDGRQNMFSRSGSVWVVVIFLYATQNGRGKCIITAFRNTMLRRRFH